MGKLSVYRGTATTTPTEIRMTGSPSPYIRIGNLGDTNNLGVSFNGGRDFYYIKPLDPPLEINALFNSIYVVSDNDETQFDALFEGDIEESHVFEFNIEEATVSISSDASLTADAINSYTSLLHEASTIDDVNYTFSSVSLTGGKIAFASLYIRHNAGNTPTDVVLSGGGRGDWTRISANVDCNDNGSLWTFMSYNASDTSGAITTAATAAGDSTYAIVRVVQANFAYAGGSLADAVVQIRNARSAGSVSSMSVSMLNAFDNAANSMLVFGGAQNSTSHLVNDTDFNPLGETYLGASPGESIVGYAFNQTTATQTASASQRELQTAIEVNHTNAAPTASTAPFVAKLAEGDSADSTTYTFSKVTLDAGKVAYAAVYIRHTSANAPTAVAFSGGGRGTWTAVTAGIADGNNLGSMWTFRSYDASSQSGSFTATLTAAGAASAAMCVVVQAQSANTGGTNGSAATVQVKPTIGASATSATVTLTNPLADSTNAMLVFGSAQERNLSLTKDSDFTLLDGTIIESNNGEMQASYRINDTTATQTVSSAIRQLMIGIEVDIP